jgi:hypothetical protein
MNFTLIFKNTKQNKTKKPHSLRSPGDSHESLRNKLKDQVFSVWLRETLGFLFKGTKLPLLMLMHVLFQF